MKTNQTQKNIPPDWRQVKLGDIGKVSMCKRIFKNETFSQGEIPFYKIGTFGSAPDAFISKKLFETYKNKYPYPKKGDILISASGTIGRTVVFDGEESYFQDSNIVWISNPENKVLNKFLEHVYKKAKWTSTDGGIISRLYNENLRSIKFLLPPLPEQNRIVSVLETWDNTIEKLSKKIEVKKQIKKGLMQDLLTGKKRLKGFSANWKTFEIGDLLNYEQPTKYIVNNTNYSNKNLTPVLTANKGFVLGYTDEIEGIYKSVPVIIFDDFTMDNKFVDFPFKIKSSAIKILTPKSKSVNLKFIFGKIQLIDVTIGEHRRHYLSEYQYLTIDVPDIREQDAIEKILSTADIEIKRLENKLKILKEQKRYLLNNLITGTIRTPETLSAKLIK